MGKCAMKYNKYTQGVHRTSSQHKWKIYETNTKQIQNKKKSVMCAGWDKYLQTRY